MLSWAGRSQERWPGRPWRERVVSRRRWPRWWHEAAGLLALAAFLVLGNLLVFGAGLVVGDIAKWTLGGGR